MGIQSFLQKITSSAPSRLLSNKGLLLCILIFTINLGHAQTLSTPQREFHAAANLIAQKTANVYKLLRLGKEKVPTILTKNKTLSKNLPETEKNTTASIKSFAQSEAQYIAVNVLALPDNANLEESGTQK